MAQWLRLCDARTEELSSVPSTSIRQISVVCNSRVREIQCLQLSWAPALMCMYHPPHIHIYK